MLFVKLKPLEKLLKSKLGENWNFFFCSPSLLLKWKIYIKQGISSQSRPVADEQEVATRFHALWPLTLCQTVLSGEAEKNYITYCLDVMLSYW